MKRHGRASEPGILGTANTRILLGSVGNALRPIGLRQAGTLVDHDLLVVLSGTMGFRFGDGLQGPEGELGAGEGVLLWPGDRCETRMIRDVHLAWFHFHFTQPGSGPLVLPPFGSARPLVEKEIVGGARRVVAGELGAKQDLEAKLWVELARGEGKGAGEKAWSFRPLVAVRADRGIEQALSALPPDRWTLKEAARALGSHPNALGEKLRRETGRSFRDLVWEKRLEKARPLLEAGRPLAEVAEASGFADAFSFSHAFRRREGRPPRGD